MTRSEAIKELKTDPLVTSDEWNSDYYKNRAVAFNMAVRSLEIWDKVREEILSLPIDRGVWDCLCIIDKYLKEVEE